MRCTICSSAKVNQVDELLGGGTSSRAVSRMTGFSRSTVSRHRQHARRIEGRFGVIEGEGGSSGPLDPLEEAMTLFRRATTERERLRAAEAIRAATALAVRRVKGEADAELLERLDENVVQAAELFRSVDGSFENALRALQGVREAIRLRLDAVRTEGEIEVPMPRVTFASGDPIRPEEADTEPRTYRISVARHFDSVPERFHDVSRFSVERTSRLTLGHRPLPQRIRVRDAAGALVWTNGVE